MSDTSCPNRKMLLAYHAGRLPDNASESVKTHVGGCPACQATLQTLADAHETRGTPPRPRAPAGALPSMSQPEVASLGQLGEYKLLEKLGEGGMGTVYKALHTELERVVALKVLPKGRMEDAQAVARFKREMKAIGRLDHPNIVRAHDAREIDGTHFLVMEHVEGMDLTEVSQRLGPLPVADACELARQAARGLEYAHQRGLVHRDIKPSNLMLARDGQVKILDLGLARICAPGPADAEMTAAGLAMGTPDYMAPEQASDSHMVDARADVYSLGCTLYKLLSGRAPFSGPEYASAFDKMTAHVRDPIPPIRQFCGDVPDALVAVLDRMLAKTAEQRFATSGEVAAALEPFTPGCDPSGLSSRAEGKSIPPLRDRPHTPGTPTPHPAVWWRQPRVLAVGLLVAVAALVALGIAIYSASDGDGPIAQQQGTGTAGTEQEGHVGVELPGNDSRPGPAGGATTPPGSRDWIVLSRTMSRMGMPDLWLFSPDGNAQLHVTNNPRAFDIHPNFSPDGRQIAFTRGTSATESTAIWVCNTDGSNCRPLATPQNTSERFVSPVWVSDTRIYFACDPKADHEPDMEIWQVDLDGEEPQRVFRFEETLSEGGGLVTDVSPDGKQLALIAQKPGLWPTADVYITDLKGKPLHTLWSDLPDDHKDARALWSPDGKIIAWHHNFSAGTYADPMYYGVGMARLEADGKWTARLQLNEKTFVTPLAWAPHGRMLLCARIQGSLPRLSRATLFLVDDQFQPRPPLFSIQGCCSQPPQRDFGRLADWADVPADAPLPLPPPEKPPLPKPR